MILAERPPSAHSTSVEGPKRIDSEGRRHCSGQAPPEPLAQWHRDVQSESFGAQPPRRLNRRAGSTAAPPTGWRPSFRGAAILKLRDDRLVGGDDDRDTT